jgi:hypothetical protein
MNFMKIRLPIALTLAWLAHGAAFAQMPSAGSPTDLNSGFMALFSSFPGFTAKVDTQVLDQSQKQTVRLLMTLAAMDKKVRVEVNLADVKSGKMPENALASLKQMGMDRVVSIIRPDKKATYVLYPGAQSYVTMPLAKEEVEAWDKGLQTQKTRLGKETVGDHDCVKNRVVVKNGQAQVFEATTWNASALKDFPMQIETKEKGNTVIMQFSQVQLAKPDANQFEVPKGYGLMK